MKFRRLKLCFQVTQTTLRVLKTCVTRLVATNYTTQPGNISSNTENVIGWC